MVGAGVFANAGLVFAGGSTIRGTGVGVGDAAATPGAAAVAAGASTTAAVCLRIKFCCSCCMR